VSEREPGRERPEPGPWREREPLREPLRPEELSLAEAELWRDRAWREEVAERLKRSMRARIGALRRWARYYERKAEETGLEMYRRLARRKLAELTAAAALYSALKAAGFDLWALAVAEVFVRASLDTAVFTIPQLPEWAKELYKALLAQAARRHHSLVGERRTGWGALIDCEGDALEALRRLRPADPADFYAYVRLSDEEEYHDSQGRLKVTDVLTVRLFRRRLGDVDPSEAFEAAWREARRLAEERGLRIDEVCVAVRGRV